MTSLALVRALEERAFNAWPALQTVIIDDWIVRLSGGYSRRANSASPLKAGTVLGPALGHIEDFYDDHSMQPVFRISPLCDAAVERDLQAAGYEELGHTMVMTASNSALPLDNQPSGVPDHVSIELEPTSSWLDAFCITSDLEPSIRKTHDAMIYNIPFPTAFASVQLDGKAVAFGLGVLERDMVGIFHVFVDERYRGHGLAKDITSGLMAWGQKRGSSGSYLQAVGTNTAAISLYTKLGFSEVYRYHYYRRPIASL